MSASFLVLKELISVVSCAISAANFPIVFSFPVISSCNFPFSVTWALFSFQAPSKSDSAFFFSFSISASRASYFFTASPCFLVKSSSTLFASPRFCYSSLIFWLILATWVLRSLLTEVTETTSAFAFAFLNAPSVSTTSWRFLLSRTRFESWSFNFLNESSRSEMLSLNPFFSLIAVFAKESNSIVSFWMFSRTFFLPSPASRFSFYRFWWSSWSLSYCCILLIPSPF